jgi:hypothetical protein
MTRTAAVIRVRHRCAELEAAWLDRTELPPEELSALYLRRDILENELAQLTTEDVA